MSVAIELANETAEEAKTRDRLVRVLDTYPLERWQFTDRVRIEGGAISHSHPVLTLGTGYPSDLAVLSSYLHEQLHWFSASCAGNDAVLKQLRDRYPEPPIGYPDGARDEHASYVHYHVCYLELRSLAELIGAEAARGLVLNIPYYRSIYRDVVEDEEFLAGLFESQGLLPK